MALRITICSASELNFDDQQIEGLGPLSYEVQRGMYVHPTYAVTPEWLPLGVIDARMWVREKVNADGARPGLKERGRWIEGYGRIAEMAAAMPATRLVYVADREADMIELMIQYGLDGIDQIESVTDTRNRITRYTTDGLGNQTLLESPDSGTTATTFDAAGKPKTVTDARGKVTTCRSARVACASSM